MMKNFTLVLLILFAFSCAKKEKEKEVPKTGVEIVSLGTANFGGTLVGSKKDAAIEIYNHGPEKVDLKLDEQILNPFSVVSRSVNCLDGKLDLNKKCTISVRFTPSEEGEFKLDFSVNDQKINFVGVGLVSGVLQLDQTNWEIGNSSAGIIKSKTFKLKNLGDLTVKSPQFNLPSYITLGFNECGSFIPAKAECRFSLDAQMTAAREYNDTLRFESEDGGFVEILLTSLITPSTPSGLIQFKAIPESMSSEGEEFLIESKPITDAFGNIVTDGTIISVNVNSNLLILTGNQYETVDGQIDFKIRTKTIKGNGTISVTSDQANGYISFPITAGEPFGNIGVTSAVSNIPANGLTQVIISTDTIFDQYSNIVEDGTPVYFKMIGDATISTGANPKSHSSVTINGKANVVVQAGTKAEVETLKIFAGPIYNQLNEIVGYRANGEINLTFEPGPAVGNLLINSSLNAIYSDSNPQPDIVIPTETLVTLGPIKDQFGNTVKPNSEISVNITDGFNISGAIPESEFKLYTDSDGYAFFSLIGNKKRGYIKIEATSSLASGSKDIWGYLRNQLKYASSSNDVNVFFNHSSTGELPSPLVPWGKAEKPDYTGDLDGIYYGYSKLSNSPETKFIASDNFPLFSWDCFFSAGDDLIGSFCMQEDETYSPMIRYTRSHAIDFDSPETNPSPELVQNTDFNLQNKLDFWGGVVSNPYGTKWSSSHAGTMWIDNRNPIEPDSGETKKRGISDWITINPQKKYLLKFTFRDQIGDNDNRFGEVGIIEGDAAYINDPAYELPPPIILKGDYFGAEIEGIVQRVIYTPTGDSNIIKLYFSTKGTGYRTEIKVDNISFKELNTQNIHDNFSTEGVSVAYMKELDTALMFGGNDLVETSYACSGEEGNTTDDVLNYNASSGGTFTFPSELSFDSAIGDTEILDLNLTPNLSSGVSPSSISVTANGENIQGLRLQEDCSTRSSNQESCIVRIKYKPTSINSNNKRTLKINSQSINLFFSSFYQGGNSYCSSYSAQSSNRTTLLKRIQDQSVGIIVNTYDENNNFDLGSQPQPMGHVPLVGLDKEIYGFGGFTSGGFGSASDSLVHFDGVNLKWKVVSPEGDLDLPEEEQMPSARYQNGILYIPELNNLYVMGGLSQNPDQASDWITNDDFWKLDLDESQLYWDRLCNNCNLFPNNIYPSLGNLQDSLEQFPDFEGKYDEYKNAVQNIKRTNAIWHSATQKAYLFLPESDFMYLFDPYKEVFSQPNPNSGMYVLRDSFQLNYNSKTGRTYGYLQGDPLLGNSQIWYWDMDRDQKQFLRYQFNLAENAKTFVQELKISIYGYGNSTTYRLEKNYVINGIEAYLFDHDSNTWVSIGFNESKNNLDAQNPLEFSIDLPIQAKRFVSDEGKLELLITPRGRPGYNGGETLMGNDLEPVDLGRDYYNVIEEVKDISVGKNYSCALMISGAVKCWGRNDYGQLGTGLSTPSVGEAINEMGDYLNETKLFDSENSNNAGLFVEKIYSGNYHSCALFNNKRIKCWGRNDYGQLGFNSSNTIVGDGFGEMEDNLPFVELGTKDGTAGGEIVEVEDLAIGDFHTCAYLKVKNERDIHRVKCWGRNNYGQLGYGDGLNRGLDPSKMGNNLPYVNQGTFFDNEIGMTRSAEIFDLALGKNHSCISVENDDNESIKKLLCWGHNTFGQLGIEDQNGDIDLANRVTPSLTDIRTYDIFKLSAGGDHSCIYYNNNLRNESYCWGRNNYGQLGRGGSDEPILLNLPTNIEFEFRDVNETYPIPVSADQSQGIVPNANALFRKMTRFEADVNSRIQFDHLASHDLADQDFVIEFEMNPFLNENSNDRMPILSKVALSTGVYDSTPINQVGGWVLRINENDRLELYSEGLGIIGQSISLDEGFQKIRVIRTLDSTSGHYKIKFYRNLFNEWTEITDLSFNYNLDGVNISNGTDAPLVIGSVFDGSPTVGIQRTEFFDGYIGYVFMEIGNDVITFEQSSIPSSDLLSTYVDLGEGLDVLDFSIGEDHTCALFTNNQLKCFGKNDYGQTGYDYNYDYVGINLNDMGSNLKFVEIGYNEGDYLPVSKIQSGGAHNCVLIEGDNTVKCWGYNGFGQLGQEDQKNRGRGFPLEKGENSLFIDFVGLEGIF